MKEAQISALLGRPLTDVETTNFKLYLKIANEALESLTCMSFCDQSDPKTFDTRKGYSTLYTDIFTEINEVKINGTVIDSSKYSKRQWGKRNGSWYNAIVFDTRFDDCQKEVEVSAVWGFNNGIPADLQSVLAGLFDLIGRKNKIDPTIQNKKVEDFSITFRADVDLDEEFDRKYSSVLTKYSMCDIPNVQHGEVCEDYGRYPYW